MERVFADEEFGDDFGDGDVAFGGEVDDVVERGALEEGLAFAFQAVAGEAVLGVEIECLIGHDDLGGGDAVEGGDFGAAFLAGAVGFFEALEMGDGVAGELLELAFDFGDVFFERGDVFVGFEGVELGDAFDADLGEAGDVVVGDFAFEDLEVGFEAFPDGGDDGLPGGALFDVAVDAFFDEDFFEGGEVPFFLELAEFDFEFAAKDVAGVFGADFDEIVDGEESGFVVVDDDGVGGEGEFAVGEGVEGLDGLVGVDAWGEVDEDFDFSGGVVLDTEDLDFALFVGGDDGVHQGAGGGAEGDLDDAEDVLFVAGFDAGANADAAASEAAVVVGGVHDAALGEIGEDVEILFAEGGDAGVAEFDEVVGEDAAGEADGDALDALGEEEGEFDGQGDGFFVSSVIGSGPVGDFWAEGDVESEFGEAGFDVTGGGGVVAREDVAPVALGIDEEFLLSELDHGVANGGVTMGVVFHGVADDVGDLVVAAVFEFVHGMEDAALNGFEAVIDVGDGAFEDDVGSVIEKPVAVEIVDGTDFDGSGVFEDGFVRCAAGLGFGSFFGHCEKSGKVWERG